MIRCKDFRKLVIKPTLQAIHLYSPEAEELLVGTMAQETQGGFYLAQTVGPALGVYQMEPRTHDDLLSWIHKAENHTYEALVDEFLRDTHVASRMAGNLYYATAIARLFYYRIEEEKGKNGSWLYPLPAHDDLESIWKYYKLHWNTNMGKATQQEFYKNYADWTKT